MADIGPRSRKKALEDRPFPNTEHLVRNDSHWPLFPEVQATRVAFYKKKYSPYTPNAVINESTVSFPPCHPPTRSPLLLICSAPSPVYKLLRLSETELTVTGWASKTGSRLKPFSYPLATSFGFLFLLPQVLCSPLKGKQGVRLRKRTRLYINFILDFFFSQILET